jgi:hypothetical protein
LKKKKCLGTEEIPLLSTGKKILCKAAAALPCSSKDIEKLFYFANCFLEAASYKNKRTKQISSVFPSQQFTKPSQ